MKENLISYYGRTGELSRTEPLTVDGLESTSGMMVRCYLKNGDIIDGYSTVLDSSGKKLPANSFGLWTWKYLDEKTHTLTGNGNTKYDQTVTVVMFSDIAGIDAILYSNPRWGGPLTNRFFISVLNSD